MRPSTTCGYPVLTAETTCWTLYHPLLGQTNYIIIVCRPCTQACGTPAYLHYSYHMEYMVARARINICCLPSGSRFTVDKEMSIDTKY